MTKQSKSWKPRSFQLEGVKRMVSQAALGLLYKPGRGKTSVVLMALRVLQDAGFVKKLLVVAPIRPMYNVWPRQPADYDEFKHFKVNVMHGAKKEQTLKDDGADIYVVNPEGLEWLFGASIIVTSKGKKVVLDPARVAYVTSKFQMLVVDESTKFKAYATNRFKIIRQVVPKFRRRYILTGSPRPKGLMDLFGQVFILDEGSSLGKYISHYRQEFFHPAGFGGYDWEPNKGALEEIIEKMGKLAQVVDEAPEDMPELVIDDRYVELPPNVRALYRQMEDKLMLDDEVVAANAAVKSGKLRQICNGSIYENEGGDYRVLHTLKYDALEDLIEEMSGAPLLITYEFSFDADVLAKMGIPNLSRMSPSQCDETIEKFRRGEILNLCGHPQSISLGIDGLQDSCADICMLGINWSLENYEQVIQRVQRSGNKKNKVALHRILVRDSKDEEVAEMMDKRDSEQVDFLRLLKRQSNS